MFDEDHQNRVMSEAFGRAVDALGGQVPAADVMKRTQSAISKRLRSGKPIWHDVVIAVEALTKISRHELRPDIYPLESSGPAVGTEGTPAEATRPRAVGVPEALKGLQS